MKLTELIEHLENRLEGLKQGYELKIKYDSFNDLSNLCYERNKINTLAELLELKAMIKELDRTLSLIKKCVKESSDNDSKRNV